MITPIRKYELGITMSKTKFVDEANKVIAEVIEALGNKSGSVKITTDDKTGEVVKSNIDLDLAKKLWNAVGVLEQHDANEHDAQCKHKCAHHEHEQDNDLPAYDILSSGFGNGEKLAKAIATLAKHNNRQDEEKPKAESDDTIPIHDLFSRLFGDNVKVSVTKIPVGGSAGRVDNENDVGHPILQVFDHIFREAEQRQQSEKQVRQAQCKEREEQPELLSTRLRHAFQQVVKRVEAVEQEAQSSHSASRKQRKQALEALETLTDLMPREKSVDKALKTLLHATDDFEKNEEIHDGFYDEAKCLLEMTESCLREH